MAVSDQIIGAESGGDPNAKNPNSSASGPGQFLDSTFLDTIKSARPDLAQGKSDSELLQLKTDPEIGRQMTEAYAAQNQGILSKAGLPVTPGTTYLAHFAGPGGAVGLLNADPNAPASSVLGPSVIKANPFLAGMSAGDVAKWADRKMGGTAPMSIAGPQQPAPAPAPAPAQPVQQAPAQAAPAAAPQFDLNALAATPKLANILPSRPNPFGIRAPFSLGG